MSTSGTLSRLPQPLQRGLALAVLIAMVALLWSSLTLLTQVAVSSQDAWRRTQLAELGAARSLVNARVEIAQRMESLAVLPDWDRLYPAGEAAHTAVEEDLRALLEATGMSRLTVAAEPPTGVDELWRVRFRVEAEATVESLNEFLTSMRHHPRHLALRRFKASTPLTQAGDSPPVVEVLLEVEGLARGWSDENRQLDEPDALTAGPQ